MIPNLSMPGADADGVGQRLALLLEDARGQRVGGVVLLDLADPLQDDRAVVVLVVDIVDSAAAVPDASVDHRLVNARTIHAGAAKAGQQRGMDVDHPPLEVCRDQHMLQESRHHHQGDVRFAARIEHRPAVVIRIGVLRLENHLCRQSCPLRDFDSPHLGTTADHQPNIDRQAVAVAMLDQIGERSTASAQEDRDRKPIVAAHDPVTFRT